jgi:hypothetical protein
MKSGKTVQVSQKAYRFTFTKNTRTPYSATNDHDAHSRIACIVQYCLFNSKYYPLIYCEEKILLNIHKSSSEEDKTSDVWQTHGRTQPHRNAGLSGLDLLSLKCCRNLLPAPCGDERRYDHP